MRSLTPALWGARRLSKQAKHATPQTPAKRYPQEHFNMAVAHAIDEAMA